MTHHSTWMTVLYTIHTQRNVVVCIVPDIRKIDCIRSNRDLSPLLSCSGVGTHVYSGLISIVRAFLSPFRGARVDEAASAAAAKKRVST
jgi:hypothetical protein